MVDASLPDADATATPDAALDGTTDGAEPLLECEDPGALRTADLFAALALTMDRYAERTDSLFEGLPGGASAREEQRMRMTVLASDIRRAELRVRVNCADETFIATQLAEFASVQTELAQILRGVAPIREGYCWAEELLADVQASLSRNDLPGALEAQWEATQEWSYSVNVLPEGSLYGIFTGSRVRPPERDRALSLYFKVQSSMTWGGDRYRPTFMDERVDVSASLDCPEWEMSSPDSRTIVANSGSNAVSFQVIPRGTVEECTLQVRFAPYWRPESDATVYDVPITIGQELELVHLYPLSTAVGDPAARLLVELGASGVPVIYNDLERIMGAGDYEVSTRVELDGAPAVGWNADVFPSAPWPRDFGILQAPLVPPSGTALSDYIGRSGSAIVELVSFNGAEIPAALRPTVRAPFQIDSYQPCGE
ncbi:MAG: hypothetical protein AAGF12_33500 [Myxococcota bacterium]